MPEICLRGMPLRFLFAVLIGLSLASPMAYANVRLAGIFGDRMVMQRDRDVPVWGWADRGEKVTVEIRGASQTVEAGEGGKWMVHVGPFPAGGPYEMTVTGKTAITIKDILFGDVWICSGQSNMEWGLKEMSDAATEVPRANYPDIRMTTITGHSPEPKDNLTCQWVTCSPEAVQAFSALGYYFGRDLHEALKVPIGLIATAQGAAPIRAWISPSLQLANPLFKEILEDYRTNPERFAAYSIKRKAYEEEEKKAKEEGRPAPPFTCGFFEGWGGEPGSLFNARIYPLAPLAFKGVVWYQGENDAIFKHSQLYHDCFALMIQDWRACWPQGDFPFLFVQLPWLTRDPEPVEWAEVRDAQRRTLKVKNTGMAVSTDICEPSLHPRNKSELGKRLSLLARSIAYGERLVCSGPLFDKVTLQGGKALVSFTETGSGLVVKGDKLEGFSLAGSDMVFVKAEAKIQGNQVSVYSDMVADPKFVRYAWADNPLGTLYNQEGFPTSCFRSDD